MGSYIQRVILGGSQGMTGGIKIVSEANLGSFGEITATRTTNTFTPTTLKNIEQMFLDAEEPEDYKNAAGFAPPIVRKTYINMDTSNWQQGGVTTVVSPGPGSGPSFEILQPGKEEEKRVSRGGGRKPRDQEEEVLCPEEEERRRLRRERNKLAAARCRKRRVDQTDTLQEEVELWEGKKRVLQEQIQALQSEREELQFILEAHRSVCTRGVLGVRSQNIQSNIVSLGPRVVVKTEPEVQETSTHLTHAEAMEQQQHNVSITPKFKPKRPSSLTVTPTPISLSSLNIPIETPTNVMNQLDFNALMDGRTGLTPTNILNPILVSVNGSGSLIQGSSSSSLTSVPTCGSQQRTSNGRNIVMQELGSPSTGAPNLVSL